MNRIKRVIAFSVESEGSIADCINKWMADHPTCEYCYVEMLTLGGGLRWFCRFVPRQTILLLTYTELQ